MTAPRVTIIGVGNLIEVIWPTVEKNIGGPDVAERVIGVTADASDLERKAAHFGFEMVLDDNLAALNRNAPDVIMFAPPPSIAPGLIESVLQPYFSQRRSAGEPLPELYAFPPVPAGATYREVLGDDVLVANIIPNNVTSIAGEPLDDEGYYVCTFASPWPEDRLQALRSTFEGQGAFVRLEPHQLIPMLGGAAPVSALWFAVPVVADLVGASHTDVGRFLRAQLNPDAERASPPPKADTLAAMIRGWHRGVRRYYEQTDIEPAQAELLLTRSFDLTLHTTAAEPREVLTGHSVGAATKGGVLEKAIHQTRSLLLPEIEVAFAADRGSEWEEQLGELVVETCRIVREHGETLAAS